jgi:hypothetical protein
MRKLLFKHKYHFIIWCVLLVYLLSANNLYITYILKHGKPAATVDSLPPEFSEVLYSIDIFSFLQYDGQEAYFIKGWAFFDTDKPNPDKIHVVFKGDNDTYLFDATPYSRKDVRSHFSNYDLNEKRIGFTTYISKNPIKIGTYQLGLILEDESGPRYRKTRYFIKRTPNTMRLMDIGYLMGDPIKESIIPEDTNKISYYFDEITPQENNRPNQFSLIGWCFHEESNPDIPYEKLLELTSEENKYVFQSETYKRPDVTIAFSTLGRNLDDSGFRAYVNTDKVKPGSYQIALILKSSESAYRIVTQQFLQISEGNMTLEKR